jgi:3-hydroxyacyl-[acyl-carrier-protein] dehydratase
VFIKDFYKYETEKAANGEINALVYLNPEHEIYKGHFPGRPVVPGVCQMLIIKEILSVVLKKDIRLVSSRSIKFLSVIDPEKVVKVRVSISYKQEEGKIKAVAGIFNDEIKFFKLKGVYGER